MCFSSVTACGLAADGGRVVVSGRVTSRGGGQLFVAAMENLVGNVNFFLLKVPTDLLLNDT